MIVSAYVPLSDKSYDRFHQILHRLDKSNLWIDGIDGKISE